MKTYFRRHKCENCGKLYDPVKGACPECQTPHPDKDRLASFEKTMKLSPFKEGASLLVGWPIFHLIAILISYFLLFLARDSFIANGFTGNALREALLNYEHSARFNGALNLICIGIIGVLMFILLGKDMMGFFKTFKDPKTYFGFFFGIGVMAFSILWSFITRNLFNAGTSTNQASLENFMKIYPFFSILCLGIIGPFSEELTYRVGLFGLSKRWNRIAAYIIGSVFFGLIHMHPTAWGNSTALFNDLISLPDYIFAGAAFCFAYERFGLGASFIAHSTNNLISVILSII